MSAARQPTVAARYSDLEEGLNHTYRFAVILADMLEDMLPYNKAEKIGSDAYRFTLGREELENVAFLAVQTQYAARQVKDQFYGIVHSERAS